MTTNAVFSLYLLTILVATMTLALPMETAEFITGKTLWHGLL